MMIRQTISAPYNTTSKQGVKATSHCKIILKLIIRTWYYTKLGNNNYPLAINKSKAKRNISRLALKLYITLKNLKMPQSVIDKYISAK